MIHMSGRRPPTGSRGVPPPPTLSKTIYNPMVPNTGRPSSRSLAQGMGVLSSQLKVADRPVTQQGLRGIKTGSKGPNRQVQDRSYYMGLLRGKIQELSHEVSVMNKEVEAYNQENATFLTFEKRAEVLASQIKELQGEMADYNTLMDKLNTDTEIDVVLTDLEMLSKKSDQEARNIDGIFAMKQEKTKKLEYLRSQLDSKRRVIEKMVESMEHNVARRYQTLAVENSRIRKDLLEEQDTLNKLTVKVQQLKEEISQSPIKKEAFRLHQQLIETTAHLEEWRKTEGETAQQEQERLLLQVKADNQEMGSIEKRSFELQDQLNVVQDQLNQVNSDMTHLHGERNDKYKELKRREESMKEFLETFEESKSSEKMSIQNLESDVVVILEHISQNISQSQHMPSADEYQDMQANLAFKQTEREKSEVTTKTLDDENIKLQSDLCKVEDLENKITAELSHLKTEIDTMEKEIIVFGDLEGLHMSEDEKRQLLEEERKMLLHRRSQSQTCTKDLSSEYEDIKSQFSDNDTYCQLRNLERKWKHHEQNNFVMKEFIATKQAEGNYLQVSMDVCRLIKEYNNLLCQSLSGIVTNN